MAWIELHQSLRDHHKIMDLADDLGIEEAHAIGCCASLWLWCLDYAPEGNLPHNHRKIARAAKWNGDADAFVQAMMTCGFIEGDYTVHDWDEYALKLIERKRANRDRMRLYRAQNERVQRTDEDVQRDVHTRVKPGNVHVQSDLTVPNQTIPNLTGPDLKKTRTMTTYSPEFEEFWSQYPSGHGIKKTAYGYWQQIPVDERNAIFTGLDRWKASRRWQDGFIKDAERWLRDEMWRNPPTENPARDLPRNKNGTVRVNYAELAAQLEAEER